MEEPIGRVLKRMEVSKWGAYPHHKIHSIDRRLGEYGGILNSWYFVSKILFAINELKKWDVFNCIADKLRFKVL